MDRMTVVTWFFFILFVGLVLRYGDTSVKFFTTGTTFVNQIALTLQGR